MALQKIGDFEPNYRESFEGKDIKGMDVYTQVTSEKIGTVNDILVDEQGQFRYFVIEIGFWVFGKKVLLPIGRSQINQKANLVYVVGLSKQQAEELPEFTENLAIDYDHEEQVRGVYRAQTSKDAISAAATAGSEAAKASSPLPTAMPTPISKSRLCTR